MQLARPKILASFLAMLVFVSVAAWFSFLRFGGGGPVPPLARLRVGTLRAEISAPIWIAKYQGYFSEQGLEVEIVPFQTGRLAANALLKGEVDLATGAEYVAAYSSFERNDLRILAVLSKAQFTELVAQRNGTITRPIDIKGKRIGIPLRTHVDYFLARFLASNGISPAKVNIVDLAPSAQLEAIRNKSVDAVVGFEPYLSEIKRGLDDKFVSWTLFDHDFYWLLLSTTGRLQQLSDRPYRFLAALAKAEMIIQNDSKIARELVHRCIGNGADISSWEKYTFDMGLPQPLLSVMEEEARWIIETGLVKAGEVPNFLDYLHLSPLIRAKRHGISLIE